MTRDKSIEGFIGSGMDDYAGLAEFRDWLIELREDRDGHFREKTRRNGRPGNGPYTLASREQILHRLLALQQETGYSLISSDEVAMIKQIWISDTLIDADPPTSEPHAAPGSVDLPMPSFPEPHHPGPE